MAKAGVDIAPITEARHLVDPAHFHCWMELHIEQGPVLVAKDKPVGIVTGIRGNARYPRIVCRGEAAHSGAVPRWLRHDAVLAMAELLMRIDEHWRVLLEWGEDLVVTSGIVETNAQEHAISRVPGEVSFALEFRSQDTRTLRSFEALVRSECAQIEAKRGVTFELGASVYTEPARMSAALVELIESIAAGSGVPCEIMASGGGTIRRSSPMPAYRRRWSSYAMTRAVIIRMRRWTIRTSSWVRKCSRGPCCKPPTWRKRCGHDRRRADAIEAARIVLEAGAVYTRTSGDPFFFSSGWASPVFIDIKRLISFPSARDRLLTLALDRIDREFGRDGFELIAGCELAGVPFAAMVADRRGLPLVVAMKQRRGFGRLSQLEGTFESGTRTLLIDDLTTDGRTKATFKRALESAEARVIGIFVFLDYGIFPASPDITSLMTLSDIVGVARESKHLDPAALHVVTTFASDAPRWSRQNGGIGSFS